MTAGPFSPPPVSGLDHDMLPPYVANGIVGLRVPSVPWLGRHAVVNGLAGRHPEAEVECVPPAPYPLGGDLRLGRAWLTDEPYQVEPIDQFYDFARGELTSRFRFHAGEVTAEVTVLTFASIALPTVVVQRTTVSVSDPCALALRAQVSPGDLPGRVIARNEGLHASGAGDVDGALAWEPLGGLSTAGIAYATRLEGVEGAGRSFSGAQAGPLRTTYEIDARPGARYELWQLAALVPQRAHQDPHREATRLVAFAARIGGEELRRRHHRAWDDLWRSRPVLLGAEERWQRLVDAAFFYLHTSVHPSSLASTNIFGLAQWRNYHYYYGHVMWDIESFVVPPLLLTDPRAARPMLQYRSRSLDAARYNAQLWGYRGAQFPWESGPLSGNESAPDSGDAAQFEHHVSMSVSHAFAQYFWATGDLRFLREHGWPVQADVADWIASRVTRTDRGFEIRRAMGIAEREEPSDNVAYVNLAAKVALDDAIATAQVLDVPVPPVWAEIRRHLVVPRDGDVILDHDGYTPEVEKGATPAALCALFPLGAPVDPATEEATTRFYLALADQYLGSPMLSGLYAAWAARIGDRGAARHLLEEGYAAFVSPRFLTTYEYRPDRFPDQPLAGPFMANIGAFLTTVLYGFTGLERRTDDPATWPRRPVVMPEGWDGITVERIWTPRGDARLEALQGEPRCRLTLS